MKTCSLYNKITVLIVDIKKIRDIITRGDTMVDEGKTADCSKSGILSNNDRYSLFQIGDLCIKFKTSPYLKRYTEILKWNNGYIECMAVRAQNMENN